MSITSKVSDNVLIEMMESIQEICAVGHSIRTKNKIRARLPLPKLIVVDPEGNYSWLPFAPDLVAIIKNEVNVKYVIYTNQEDLEIVM